MIQNKRCVVLKGIASILVIFIFTSYDIAVAAETQHLTKNNSSYIDQFNTTLGAISNILSDAWKALSHSFQANSVSWIVISTALVGALTAIIKYLAEQYIPQLRIKKARRVAIQKYSYPLYSSAFNLAKQLDDLLLGNESKFSNTNDNLYRLKLLYFFGSYLGWIRILEKEAVIEYSEDKDTLINKKIQKFYNHYGLTLKGLTSWSYFVGHIDFKKANSMKRGQNEYGMYKKGDYMSDINADRYVDPLINKDTAYVDSLVLAAIGELMINKPQEKRDELHDVISFVDFVHNYENSADFKKWFCYIEKMIDGLTYSQSDAKRNRLLVVLCFLTIFLQFIAQSNFRFMSVYVQSIVIHYLSPKAHYSRLRYRINNTREERKEEMGMRKQV